MAILKKLLVGLIVLVLLLVAVAFALPKQRTVQRSAVFQAKPAAVYAYLNGYRRFNEWSPWAHLDPKAQYTLEGPPVGVGAKQSWASKDPNVGSGSQEIIEVKPYSLIKAKLTFADWDNPSLVSYAIAPEGQGTKLTWTMETDLGNNPMNRWFGTLLDKMVGGDYEKGLANLKPHLEALSKDDIEGIAITAAQSSAVPYLFVSDSAQEAEAPAKLAAALKKVNAFMEANGLRRAAPPLALTRKFDEKTGYWEFNAGIPVDRMNVPTPPETGLQYAQTYAGAVLRAEHIGPYTAMQPSYGKLIAYKTAAGLEDNGSPWEQYITDPATMLPEKLVTYIYWPVK